MDLSNYLQKVKQDVDKELNIFFDAEIKSASRIGGQYNKQVIEFLKEYLLRGKSKRVRAGLVSLGYELFGGKNRQSILKACLAYELIHNAWLIHDDIIDRDNIRRGKPAMHKSMEFWLKRAGVKKDLKHLGISMAILAGDIAIAMSEEQLFSMRFKNEDLTQKIFQDYYRSKMNTVYGEILDVIIPFIKTSINIKNVLKICELKTAKYTFEEPLRLGAIIAGAKEKDLEIISEFGIPVGVAFQFQDDILGMFGSSQQIGKQAGSDLEEGKITLLILKTLELGNNKQKAVINKLLKKQKIIKKDLELARQIIQNTGALEATQKYAEKLTDQGKKALTKLKGVNPQHQELLFQLADYIIKRKY